VWGIARRGRLVAVYGPSEDLTLGLALGHVAIAGVKVLGALNVAVLALRREGRLVEE